MNFKKTNSSSWLTCTNRILSYVLIEFYGPADGRRADPFLASYLPGWSLLARK